MRPFVAACVNEGWVNVRNLASTLQRGGWHGVRNVDSVTDSVPIGLAVLTHPT
jgi:hypothetical protein